MQQDFSLIQMTNWAGEINVIRSFVHPWTFDYSASLDHSDTQEELCQEGLFCPQAVLESSIARACICFPRQLPSCKTRHLPLRAHSSGVDVRLRNLGTFLSVFGGHQFLALHVTQTLLIESLVSAIKQKSFRQRHYIHLPRLSSRLYDSCQRPTQDGQLNKAQHFLLKSSVGEEFMVELFRTLRGK